MIRFVVTIENFDYSSKSKQTMEYFSVNEENKVFRYDKNILYFFD